MKWIRGLAAAVALTLLAATLAAQEPRRDDKKGRPERPGAFQPKTDRPTFPFVSPNLLPKAAVEKLKLTEEQQKKYDKVQSEFADKVKETADKVQEAMKGGDPAKIRELLDTTRTEVTKRRDEYLVKVEALLTDEQKKTFAEIKNDRGTSGFPRPGDDRSPFGRPQPGAVGEVLPRPVQDQLKLTDEQKKKLEELQKDVETKLQKILSDEQQKQLDELKKQRPSRPRPSDR